jgi:DnaK suppressor protein
MSPTRSVFSAPRSTSPSMTTLMSRFERALAEAAETRQQQLEGLATAETDEVTRAQREALNQVLQEISTAQKRMVEGTFGFCTGCAQPIPVERLEIRPWSATCVTCASR